MVESVLSVRSLHILQKSGNVRARDSIAGNANRTVQDSARLVVRTYVMLVILTINAVML